METIKAAIGLTDPDNTSTEPVSGIKGEGSAPAPYDAGNDPTATEAAERERTTQESGSLATDATEAGTDTKQQSIVSSVIESVVGQLRGTSLTGTGTGSNDTSQHIDDRAVDPNPPPAPPGEREELNAEPDSSGPATDYENTSTRPVAASQSSGGVDATSTSGEPPVAAGEREEASAIPASSGPPTDYENTRAQPHTSSTSASDTTTQIPRDPTSSANDYNTSTTNDTKVEATTVSDPTPAGEREEARAEPVTSEGKAPVDYEETQAQPATTSSSSSGQSGERDETTTTTTTDSARDDNETTTKSETDHKSSGSAGDKSGKPKENPSAIPTAGGIRLGEKNVPERVEADENQGKIAPVTPGETREK